MADPNKNFAAVVKAADAVRAHPMCGKFSDLGGTYLVIYPAGDFPVNGVRVSQRGGKRAALERLLAIMEKHWIESYPNGDRS